MLAYLVIREDAKWTDVFRLVPGRTVTVGRASTNQIVVKDERCSRCHAEIFHTGGNWTVRDLNSRNGTFVRGEPLHSDYVLQPGDVVVIPAGVGHKNLDASRDLLVVGAYPPGQDWDLCRGATDERPWALGNIAKVPLPTTDPIYGEQGLLLAYWAM